MEILSAGGVICAFFVDDVSISWQETVNSVVCVDASKYRFGFNGKEKDDEFKGNGNSYDYGLRIYDSRLGRFLSVDPLAAEYAWNSPFSYSENDVIRCADLDGLEKLTKTVTSDPNSETGEPGKAKIVISKSYQVVTAGAAAVPSSEKIQPAEFSKNYKRGNTTLFMSSLPSDQKEGVFLEGRNERLAKKASKGNVKAAKKLHDKGINYYVTEVVYDYEVTITPSVTVTDALNWASEDPAQRGVIAMGTETKNLASEMSGRILCDIEVDYVGFNSYNMKGKFQDPKVGAAATISPDFSVNHDIIIINPAKWKADGNYGQQRPDGSNGTTRTEDMVHEGGHNATDLGHQPGYDYMDTGLSSNTNGQVYPTSNNTKTIINNAKNRSTLK